MIFQKLHYLQLFEQNILAAYIDQLTARWFVYAAIFFLSNYTNCPGGNCPGGNCPGGNCPGGNCLGGNCPRTTSIVSSRASKHVKLTCPYEPCMNIRLVNT